MSIGTSTDREAFQFPSESASSHSAAVRVLKCRFFCKHCLIVMDIMFWLVYRSYDRWRSCSPRRPPSLREARRTLGTTATTSARNSSSCRRNTNDWSRRRRECRYEHECIRYRPSVELSFTTHMLILLTCFATCVFIRYCE